ncbi:MAG: kynureninase [Gemmatimonadales bacterium]|nr:kynureninase [Gemmatimonadales bacterium]
MRVDPDTRGEEWALRADERDPLAWCRGEFELPTGTGGHPLHYFCGHSLGLLPKSARTVVTQELDDWARFGVEAHFEGTHPWYSYHERLRRPLAAIVGAEPGEVVAMNSLTVNLHLMLVSFYRPAEGRSKILMEAGAFPSDSYAIESHIGTRGLDPAKEVVRLSPREGEATLRTEDIETVLSERGREIALVLLPGVQFVTGQLLDIPRITAAARRAGCAVGFDLAHAAGNVPLSLHEWDVDFAVWCSYKYLNGGPGAVGGCFVHSRHAGDQSLPRYGGWWGNDPSSRFRMQLNESFVPVASADGWQLSNPPILAMAPLLASLALFERAGPAELQAKSAALSLYLAYLLDDLPQDMARAITPAVRGAHGCQLSLRIRGDAAAVARALRDRDVVVDVRPPDILRVAPVPLYNTFRDLWSFRRALGELL